MDRPSIQNGVLTVVLVACGLLVAALVYGFATRTLTPRTSPIASAATVAAPDSAAIAAEEARRSRITVEVLNGTGINGLAGDTRELLRRRGFDVQSVGTTKAADSTVVVPVNGTEADAANVAGALGLPGYRILPPADKDENATTVRVTIGSDYDRFEPLRTHK